MMKPARFEYGLPYRSLPLLREVARQGRDGGRENYPSVSLPG